MLGLAYSKRMESEIKIDGMIFMHVCQVSPKTDSQGKPLEIFPQNRYENKKNLPLNRYGHGPFCKFTIDRKYALKSGVYLITIDEIVQYVGKCDDLYKRFGMGYGNISPRNCFKGGQSTNCRINSDILKMIKAEKKVQFYFHETKEKFAIECKLIDELKPTWNKTTGKPSKIR